MMNDSLVRVDELLLAVRRELERLPQEYVESCCAPMGHVEAVHMMKRMQDLNESADTAKKTIGKLYDWTRMGLVPMKMEEEGVENVRVVGIGRVSLTADLSVSMPDKPAGYRWLAEHGLNDLITETVNASSLKAVIRRRLRDGDDVPEGVFKISPFTRASITKA